MKIIIDYSNSSPSSLLEKYDVDNVLESISLELDELLESDEENISNRYSYFIEEFIKIIGDKNWYIMKVIFMNEPVGNVQKYLVKKQMLSCKSVLVDGICIVSIRDGMLFWNIYTANLLSILELQRIDREQLGTIVFHYNGNIKFLVEEVIKNFEETSNNKRFDVEDSLRKIKCAIGLKGGIFTDFINLGHEERLSFCFNKQTVKNGSEIYKKIECMK